MACSRLLLLVLLSAEASLCLFVVWFEGPPGGQLTVLDPGRGGSREMAGCLGSTAGWPAKLGVVSSVWLGRDFSAVGFEL